MRIFTSASAVIAMFAACFAVIPSATGAAKPVHPSPLTRIQPGGPIAVPRSHPVFRGPDVRNTTKVASSNWGGYASLRSASRFRYIQSTFFVPYVDCKSTPNSFSGHWVGLDGLTDGTVEQDGILAACAGTRPVYAAWYEMFPRPPVYKRITVRPGSSILASVFYNSRTHAFELSLVNTTNGEGFHVTRRCPRGAVCRRASAEVISEAPSSRTGVLPLSNFRAESYSSTKVTSGSGHHGGLRAHWWRTVSITTINKSGQILDQPTSIFHGTAFDMYWMRET